MFLELVCVVFCSRERQARGNDSLNGGIVGQIEEKCDSFHRSVLFEITCEKPSGFHVDTHSSEDNAKVFFMTVMYTFGGRLYKSCLSAYLSGDFVMRKTGS